MRYSVKVTNKGPMSMIRLGYSFKKGTTQDTIEVSQQEKVALESTPNLSVEVVEEIPENEAEREMLNRESPPPPKELATEEGAGNYIGINFGEEDNE